MIKMNETLEDGKKVVEYGNSIAYNLISSVKNDYLTYIIVTSKTQAAIKSEQRPYGSGKTTQAMQISVRMQHPKFEDVLLHQNGYEDWKPPENADDDLWEKVFKFMAYNPCDVRDNFFSTRHERIRFAIWDDTQITAPRSKGVPKFVVLIVGEATAARPEVSNFCMTAPNILSVAAPLRALPDFEIIIPKRGMYEIQKTVRSKVFNNPEADQGRLVPVEIGMFSDLPVDVKKRYNEWRIEQKEYLKGREYSARIRRLFKESEGMIEMVDDVDKPLSLADRIERMREQGWKGSQAEGYAIIKAALGLDPNTQYTRKTLRKAGSST